MLLGVIAAAVHVFEAPLGGDGLGGLEPRAGVRDKADAGEDLIRLDYDWSPVLPVSRSVIFNHYLKK